MPTLQQLKYLVAVAETGHFRRAAEVCNVSQGTLSGQLKELETKLGSILVERTRARVVMTPLGDTIVTHARRALREVAEIRSLAAHHEGALQSTIKLGVVPTLGPYLLPLIVPDVHQNHPKLKLYVREGLCAPLLERLDSGALDLLFFPLPVGAPGYTVRPLFREPLQLVMPADHALAAAAAIAPQSLRGKTILALERGHRLSEQVHDIGAELGAHPSPEYEGTSLDSLRQMVGTGMGLSLMPTLYVRSELADQDLVASRPFEGPQPERTIGMVWRRGAARERDYLELGRDIREILRRRAPCVTVLD